MILHARAEQCMALTMLLHGRLEQMHVFLLRTDGGSHHADNERSATARNKARSIHRLVHDGLREVSAV